MIELRDKQIVIDGEPRIIMCGEIHYFRLQREDWPDRIGKLKAAGCNAVAAYVPWLCHEPVEGQFDLDGKTRAELDLGGFIDLCHANGLYFFARPGPFIMAEIKNEGVPYWVYTKHPQAIPVSWDGKLVPSRTLDYLAPGFLEAVRHWYAAVMAVIVPRLQPNGGNVIAVQLDNEVGMLSWVTNCPDLTDLVLADFGGWLAERYDEASLTERYPFVLNNAAIRNTAIRSPKEAYAAELLRDLGHFMRARFVRYVATLRGYAEECGVTGVPFVINIHGTDRGRGLTFPIGISQLYEAYTQDSGYLAGSDHYIGDLTVANFQDLYLINACMDAVQNPQQPLSSVEFSAGNGDYANNYGGRLAPSAVDFKTRMCIAQGNRLLNYYLFAGGTNYPLPKPVHDGNDRIAFTGERHGFGAPINPEGEEDYTYPRLVRVVHAVTAVSDKLAIMAEEHDNVAFAFIPDYYMTESRYPPSARMNELVGNLEANRGLWAWENLARGMLLAGYRFGAVDIQNRAFDPRTTPVLVVPSARYMDAHLQRKLVAYLEAGGHLLLYGEVPLFDMEGQACPILADALGLKPIGFREASAFYYLSCYAGGWAAPRPEIRTHFAQVWEPSAGEVLLRVVGTDEACGFDVSVNTGRAIVIAAAYTTDVPLFRLMLERLGARAALRHDCPSYGIFMTSSTSRANERFLHILNLDGYDKAFHVVENGQALFEGRQLVLRSQDGVLLPLDVSLGDVQIVYATAEIARVDRDATAFRLTQPQDVIALKTAREIVPSEEYTVARAGATVLITSLKHAAVDDRLTIQYGNHVSGCSWT